MLKPTSIPTWATDSAAEVVAPPVGRKAIGYTANARPAHTHINWLFKTIGEWCQYLNDATLDGDHTVDGALDVTGTLTANIANITANLTANEIEAEAITANVVLDTPLLEADSATITNATISTLALSNNPTHNFTRRRHIPMCGASLFDGTVSIAAANDADANCAMVVGQTLMIPIVNPDGGNFSSIQIQASVGGGVTLTAQLVEKSGASNTVRATATSSGSGEQVVTISPSALSTYGLFFVKITLSGGSATVRYVITAIYG